MKKAIAVLLILVMMLSFGGWSFFEREESVVGLWKGSWVYLGVQIDETAAFDAAGNYMEITHRDGEFTRIETGTYELIDGKLTEYLNGQHRVMTEYGYIDGRLNNTGHIMEKVDPAETSGKIVGLWCGSWTFNDNQIDKMIVFAADGNYYEASFKNGMPLSSKRGEYVVRGGKATLYEDGNLSTFSKYDYDGEKLVNNGNIFTKVN